MRTHSLIQYLVIMMAGVSAVQHCCCIAAEKEKSVAPDKIAQQRPSIVNSAWNACMPYNNVALFKLPDGQQERAQRVIEEGIAGTWKALLLSSVRYTDEHIVCLVEQKQHAMHQGGYLPDIVRIRLFTQDGKPLLCSPDIRCGWKKGSVYGSEIVDARVVNKGVGDALLLCNKGSPYERQYYGVTSSGIQLLRIENGSSRLVRNNYNEQVTHYRGAYGWVVGESGRETYQWNKRAMIDVLKRHDRDAWGALSLLESIYSYGSEYSEKLRSVAKDAQVMQVITALASHEELWIREAAAEARKACAAQ